MTTEQDPHSEPDAVIKPETRRPDPAPMSGSPAQVLRWLGEGVRTVMLLRPRWQGLSAGPGSVLALLMVTLGFSIGLQRLWVVGPASFNGYALFSGWLMTAVVAWWCFALYPRGGNERDGRAPSVAHLFSLTLAQSCVFTVLVLLYGAFATRASPDVLTPAIWWGVWIGLLTLAGVALAVVLARGTGRRLLAIVAAICAIGISLVEGEYHAGDLWVAQEDSEPGKREWLQLTQSLMERQPRLLIERLEALEPQRPGTVDLYALTFAPYAHEDVFNRESAMVAEVMEQRFGTEGRTLQLVNHLDTVNSWPWATPLNLARSIHHVARVMDREEDILFIHLTSHGAAEGELAAQFWPLAIETVTPELLKATLDEAGIRNRVISVSACYSGSWVAPLADEHTLVMTAADADNTSYGCGRLSELTYFGRAVFDEQLRTQTRSFEKAHEAARPIIDQREREAGKDDGYSNPQISVGEGIRDPLEILVRRLETEAMACAEPPGAGAPTHPC